MNEEVYPHITRHLLSGPGSGALFPNPGSRVPPLQVSGMPLESSTIKDEDVNASVFST